MKSIGMIGEDLACKYLLQKNYIVVGRNYHTRYGEIDIIASNKTHIAFVEVKLRCKSNKFNVEPKLAVDRFKQKKIIKSSMIYLSKNNTQLIPRFDVIEIIKYKQKFFANHIVSAFIVEDEYEIF